MNVRTIFLLLAAHTAVFAAPTPKQRIDACIDRLSAYPLIADYCRRRVEEGAVKNISIERIADAVEDESGYYLRLERDVFPKLPYRFSLQEKYPFFILLLDARTSGLDDAAFAAVIPVLASNRIPQQDISAMLSCYIALEHFAAAPINKKIFPLLAAERYTKQDCESLVRIAMHHGRHIGVSRAAVVRIIHDGVSEHLRGNALASYTQRQIAEMK